MIYVLAGIVFMCAILCLSEGLVWIWEKLDPPTKIEEVRVHRES